MPHWAGPKEGERPSAYITIIGDERIAKKIDCDHGIASQSILLGAREQGLAGCIIANINQKRLRSLLEIADHYRILLVIALGIPKEDVVIEEAISNESIKYWRDKEARHHVPKRRLSDIVVTTYE